MIPVLALFVGVVIGFALAFWFAAASIGRTVGETVKSLRREGLL